MANHLKREKKLSVLSALVEGSSIRSAERMFRVHRDTIMRLGVRVGNAASRYMNRELRGLNCEYIEIDEIWGFVGKKQKNITADDFQVVGDVYTFFALDAKTKLVPCFRLGKRDIITARPFVEDLASRMLNRIQLSSDGLPAYYESVKRAFGDNVDYGQIVKSFDFEVRAERKYSPAKVVGIKRTWISGYPLTSRISTSHIERKNLTIRTFVRRLTRLTCAFSKKFENMRAALALHFMHYNFCRRHGTLKTTPAVAAGVSERPWTMDELLDATDGS